MSLEERLVEVERKLNTLAWFIFYNTGKSDEHSVCKELRLSESAYNQIKEMFADALLATTNIKEELSNNEESSTEKTE